MLKLNHGPTYLGTVVNIGINNLVSLVETLHYSATLRLSGGTVHAGIMAVNLYDNFCNCN